LWEGDGGFGGDVGVEEDEGSQGEDEDEGEVEVDIVRVEGGVIIVVMAVVRYVKTGTVMVDVCVMVIFSVTIRAAVQMAKTKSASRLDINIMGSLYALLVLVA
jgi:hypothetical protein